VGRKKLQKTTTLESWPIPAAFNMTCFLKYFPPSQFLCWVFICCASSCLHAYNHIAPNSLE
jgi:hypothetical protein